MKIKEVECRNNYQENARKYVINMIRGSKRTLHIKNTSCCPWSKFIQQYVDFDTLSDVESSGIEYEPCKKCFK